MPNVRFGRASQMSVGIYYNLYNKTLIFAVGKTENVWDRLSHTRPEMIADGSNGDIACDSYNRYKEDVEELVNLGVDFYRFSLSWARILPTGRSDFVNPDGIRYYNDLLDALAEKNIEPLVRINNWFLFAAKRST